MTVSVWPLTVIVPVRAPIEGFAAYVKATTPLPLPTGVVTVNHVSLDTAVHAHPDEVTRPTLELPHDAPTPMVESESWYEHGSNWNWFEVALRPVPLGPTAETRDS